MAQPLNVLFVMTDQHIAGATGYEGHPQAITPNMDRLAGEGTWFRRCYTANPICTPTRVSILSGQFCHNHGYYGLSGPTPPNLPSFLGHFREHGYRTGLFGKGHLPDDPRDWARDHCDVYQNLLHRASDTQPYLKMLADAGFPDEFDASWLTDQPGTGNNLRDARPSKLPFELSVEGYVNRLAMQFMDDVVGRDQPFCLEVSYHRPHQVYTPAQKFWDMYDDDLDLPPGAFDADVSGRPPHFQKMAERGRTMTGHYDPADPESRLRRVWKGYLACISHCDHALGELLDFLDQRGLADNTLVIYTSDHGAYSGTFGVPEKAPGICSEQVCRIPSIWRMPGQAGAGRVDHFAHITDVAPTVCSLAGLPEMDTVDGRDISPLVAGTDQPIHNVAVTEHPWSKSIRWGSWRLVHYQPEMFDGQDIGELYDIDTDPWETANLYHDADHAAVVHEGRRLLLEWLIRTTRPTTVHPPIKGEGGHRLGADGRMSNATPVTARLDGSANYI